MPALEAPVLFLVFNRPDVTARVFAAIRAAQPRRLFVAADGPRADRPAEAELCATTRRIATSVDWPCEVTTLFREENLGCGPAVSTAISWFFSHVEEGIILEDDCLPHPDFFSFCATMLERHRHDLDVLTIAGTHFLPAGFGHHSTHYFSKYVQIWGWACWRRTWERYDFELNGTPDAVWMDAIQRACPLPIERGYWAEVFRAMKSDAIDTWDFQLQFSCWAMGGHHVVPRCNLISNLGYGPDATHTNFAGVLAQQPIGALPGPYDALRPAAPDPHVDNYIFFARFLEHLSQTWWVEQVLAPDRKLGETRAELQRKDRYIRELEREVREKRRQLLAATRKLSLAHPSAAPLPSS